MFKPNAIAGGNCSAQPPRTNTFVVDERAYHDHLEASVRRDLPHDSRRIASATLWWKGQLRSALAQTNSSPSSDQYGDPAADIDALFDELAGASDESVARELILIRSAVARASIEYRDRHDVTVAEHLASAVKHDRESDIVAATVHHPEVRGRFSEEDILRAATAAERAEELRCTILFSLHEVVSRTQAGYYPQQDSPAFDRGIKDLLRTITSRLRRIDASTSSEEGVSVPLSAVG